MELMNKVKEIAEKVQNDPELAKSFQKDPVKALEGLLGVDLPDEAVKSVIDGVKAQLAGSNILGAIEGGLENLFGKKE